MQPVVPGVRAGDILLGTRTLRRWLRAVAKYCEALHAPGLSEGFTPSRNDRYVVAANAGVIFLVFHLDKPFFIIPFVNGEGPGQQRMDGALFSKWFIRSPEKSVDIRSWPSAARLMWASAQMAGCFVNYGNSGLPTFLTRGTDATAQVDWASTQVWHPSFGGPQAYSQVNTSIVVGAALKCGTMRTKSQRGSNLLRNIAVAGPTEAEIELYEKYLERKPQRREQFEVIAEEAPPQPPEPRKALRQRRAEPVTIVRGQVTRAAVDQLVRDLRNAADAVPDED